MTVPPNTNLQPEAPFSQEAEEATLGSILIDPTQFITVNAFLKTEDFFLLRHQYIYEAMVMLFNRNEPVDMITVAETLDNSKRLEQIGGRAYLVKLLNNTGTSLYAEVYGQLIKRASIRRKAMQACLEIIRLAKDETINIDQFEAESLDLLSTAIERTRSNGAWFGEIASTVYDQVERAIQFDDYDAIPTGFTDLDALMGGGLGVGLTVLAGRPAMGKSSFLDSILYNLLIMMAEGKIDPFTIFYATTERTKEQVVRRVLSIASEISDSKLRTGKLTLPEAACFTQKIGEFAESKVYIDDTPAITPAQLESTANWLKHRHSCKLVLHDGGYRSTTGIDRIDNGGNDHIKYGRIYFMLKNASTRLHLPLLTTHQLSRKPEERADHRPRKSDLRESGRIEEEADNVLLLYRDEVYNEATEFPNQADVIVAKQRNGPTSVVSLYFEKSYTKFMNSSVQRVDLSDLE